MNPNKAMMTHKIKAAREKREFIYKGTPIRLLIDSLTETYQASRNWDNIFKISKKKKNCQPKILTWQSCSSEMKEG